MKMPSVILLCCCSMMLTGCCTVATLVGDATGKFDCNPRYTIPRAYSGVAADMTFLRDGAEDCIICAVDLPLSAAADTIILPYTLVTQSKYGNLCDKQVEAGAKP
jgi:uncharacterized protein YceK